MGTPINPQVCVGHVHLKVADLDRAIDFYSGVLGFEIQLRSGLDAAFLSAGGYHHHIALNTWKSRGGCPPDPCTTGLYCIGLRYPDEAALAQAVRRVLDAGVEVEEAWDRGVNQSIMLRDPDRNGIELYCDRPESEWPRLGDGSLAIYRAPLDLDKLLKEGCEQASKPALASKVNA